MKKKRNFFLLPWWLRSTRTFLLLFSSHIFPLQILILLGDNLKLSVALLLSEKTAKETGPRPWNYGDDFSPWLIHRGAMHDYTRICQFA